MTTPTPEEIARNLNVPQIMALQRLCRHPSSTAKDLSEAACISTAAITGLKDKFTLLGLMEETQHPTDRRKARLTATALGREVLKAACALLAA